MQYCTSTVQRSTRMVSAIYWRYLAPRSKKSFSGANFRAGLPHLCACSLTHTKALQLETLAKNHFSTPGLNAPDYRCLSMYNLAHSHPTCLPPRYGNPDFLQMRKREIKN